MKARSKMGGKMSGKTAKPGIPGKTVMDESVAPPHGFKTGGAVKLKDGGTVPGYKAGGRLDKAPRGNGMRGRSPFSSASSTRPAK